MTIADAEGAREKVDPDTTTGGEPGAMVCEPIMNSEALLAETTCEPSVIAAWPENAPAMIAPKPDDGDSDGDDPGGWMIDVAPLTISALADSAGESVEDEMTTTLPPGAVVWLPATRFEAESLISVEGAMTMTGGLDPDGEA